MENIQVDESYLEKCMAKAMMEDNNYMALVDSAFSSEYFRSDVMTEFFSFSKNFFDTYGNLPNKEVFLNSIQDETLKEDAKSFIEEVQSIELDISVHYDWIVDNTNAYLKENAMKVAVMKVMDIIEQKGNILESRYIIEDALAKDLKMDLGLDYFGQLKERLLDIFTKTQNKIPSCFPTLDEYITGGFPPYTLSVFMAQIHGFKSSFMANMAARQVMNGYNPVIFSFEMSEYMYAQRIDAILSLLDINRIYINETYKRELMKSLKGVKNKEDRGNLWIKEFPTGKATVNDLRVHLRELSLRGIKPDIIYSDYINLMKPERKSGNTTSYEEKKTISEELRALSLEFNAPIISVTQLNREGGFIPLREVDHNYTSECLDPNTEVIKENGEKSSLKNIKIGDKIKGSNGNVEVKNKFKKTKKKYKITTESGKEIICSKDHKFPTDKGFLSIESGLSEGDYLNSL